MAQQLNDAKEEAFDTAAIPGSGATNERELAYVNNLIGAGTHKVLTDAWFAYLRSQLFTGSISDMKYAFFAANNGGVVGARPEVELAYWQTVTARS